MSVVYKIGITKNSSEKITSVNSINAIAGKGIINDRFFLEQNKKRYQNRYFALIKNFTRY